MNNRFVRKSAGRRLDGAAEGNGPQFGQLTERLVPAPLFDSTGNALGQKQPPGNDVAIPRVDYGFHGLIKQIAMDYMRRHLPRTEGGAEGGVFAAAASPTCRHQRGANVKRHPRRFLHLETSV